MFKLVISCILKLNTQSPWSVYFLVSSCGSTLLIHQIDVEITASDKLWCFLLEERSYLMGLSNSNLFSV